jgi:hypothetical protein
MLRSLKLNAPGPNVFPPDMCEFELNISFRPQFGRKDGARMAANGDDSIIV